MRSRDIRIGLTLTGALLGLPLVGVLIAGKPLAQYMEFPPITKYVEHAAFLWPVFILMALLIVLMITGALVGLRRSSQRRSPPSVTRQRFPWWGWCGVVLGLVMWVLAWTRFPWFSTFQPYTFSPLWLAYILVINALTYRRWGHCMLKDCPLYFLLLFPVSAVFWWFFEYLNRFVQNWYYVGIEGLTPSEYFVYATLPFSTVLPAVMGTYEFLAFGRAPSRMVKPVRTRANLHRVGAVSLFVFSCLGLAGIGIWSDYLFPLLWISPLLIILSLRVLIGGAETHALLPWADWREVVQLALAALICGFFWEMWNYHSLAKWVYAVPFVNRFRIFEMPILGYAGYLPFGLECAVIAAPVAWLADSIKERRTRTCGSN